MYGGQYEILVESVREALINDAIEGEFDRQDQELRERDPELFAEKRAFYGWQSFFICYN